MPVSCKCPRSRFEANWEFATPWRLFAVLAFSLFASLAFGQTTPQPRQGPGPAESILAMTPADEPKALALLKSCDAAAALAVWVRLMTEAKAAQDAQLWA